MFSLLILIGQTPSADSRIQPQCQELWPALVEGHVVGESYEGL